MNKGRCDHYLVSQQAIVHERRTVVDCVTAHLDETTGELVFDSRHATKGACGGTLLPLGLRSHERAVPYKLRQLYVTNDTGRTVTMAIDLCYEAKPIGAKQNPDDTGIVTFDIPPSNHIFFGCVPDVARRLFKANLYNLGYDLTSFLGMEHSIANARSGAVVSPELIIDKGYELFLDTDPFLVYLLGNKTQLDWPDHHVQPLVNHKGYYMVAKPTLERARAFAVRVLFPLFHYTTAEKLLFQVASRPETTPPTHDEQAGLSNVLNKQAPRTLVIMLEFQYIVIYQSVPKFVNTTERLKI